MPVIWQLIDKGFINDTRVFMVPDDRAFQINISESVDVPENMVLPSELAEHFIRSAKHLFITDFCWCREAGGCKDYPVDLGCIFMGEAVLSVDPRWGREVSIEEALDHIGKAKEAGLILSTGKIYGDSILFGLKPHDKLMTICCCCPCCCALGFFKNMPSSLSMTYAKLPGIEVRVTDRCIGCGTCEDNVCTFYAIQVVDGQAVIGEECRGCGRCVLQCPEQAIELLINDDQYLKKAIEQISLVTSVD